MSLAAAMIGAFPASSEPVMHELVEKVVAELDPDRRALVLALHSLIGTATPHASLAIKWRNLTYAAPRDFCAIVIHQAHVKLQLWNGAELPDPAGLLTGTGKQMRHVHLRPGTPLPEAEIRALLEESAHRR